MFELLGNFHFAKLDPTDGNLYLLADNGILVSTYIYDWIAISIHAVRDKSFGSFSVIDTRGSTRMGLSLNRSRERFFSGEMKDQKLGAIDRFKHPKALYT
jgi:hypothetical protein